jgi:DNA-binding PucR family transcriptional regulator
VVSLVLDNAPITTGRASTGLGYDLRRRHTAAVLWTDPRRPDQGALAQAAEALGPATGARQVLTVIASSSSVWAWLAAAADTAAAALTAATAAHPAVRVAVGPIGTGIDGFRRSHFDAVATQRLMSRRPDLRVARFADVQLVALAIQDEQHAREFVARTLGTLAGADPELRDTLYVYIGEQFSAARRPSPVHPPQHGPQPPSARRTAAPPPARRPRLGNRRRARDRPVAGDATRQCHPCGVTRGHPTAGA